MTSVLQIQIEIIKIRTRLNNSANSPRILPINKKKKIKFSVKNLKNTCINPYKVYLRQTLMTLFCKNQWQQLRNRNHDITMQLLQQSQLL